MFKTLRDAWSIPEIRKKLLYTLLMLLIFRLGSAVVVPFLDTSTVSTWMASNATGGNFLEYLDIITGGALSQATVFSLSITPYINASIIMQLLTYALPPLERMRDEGEEGQKKLNKITAAVSLALSVFMSFAYYLTLKNQMNAVVDGGSKAANVFIAFVIILSFIAGTSIVVWMGNQINDKGIGNGISMLLFAGILARFPVMAGTLGELTKNEPQRYFFESLGILVLFIAMIAFIVFMNASERRIPIQYAKRVVGRKQYGGQSTHIPVKVCMSGVMPIIFAMSFMSLPSTISLFKPVYTDPTGFWQKFYNGFINFFNTRTWTYALIYFILIIAFNYFYVSMQYNPIEIANNLFGQGFLNFQNIFLPVGISFFVFQSMSYTIDICRGQLKPLNNWADYLFYLSFFPQLVAGPIVRAKDFIPQIRQNPLRVTREMFGMGVFLILIGLFKKAVISDYISLNFVDRIFDEQLLYSGFECLMGIYGYALQIYCDFSGYSDMAIGIALLLGFRFPKNFDAPYKSATITEFWRRWHISLSTWLRDYLYISLGGNRKGRIRTYFNLLVTMLLGGLWHGAAVRFILWGALHGIALALHKLWLSVVPGSKATGAEMRWFWRIPGIFFTFNLVCFGWLMFRAESMKTVQLMLHQIFTNFNPSVIPQVLEGYAGIFLLVGIGYLLHMLPDRCDRWAQRFVTSLPTVVQVLLAACVIWLVMQVKSSDIQPFIYFQF